MKNYEKKVLIKFISLYMITSLILFLFISVLFFLDQKTMILKELEDEMIAYISLSRNGNNVIANDNFKIETLPSEHQLYPIFYEDTKKNQFVSVTCASKYLEDKVFVVSADKTIINTKLKDVALKIFFTMSVGFLFFLVLAYYLAKISIRPIKVSRKIINNITEELVHDLNAPMTSISLNCESLKNRLNDEKNLKMIQRIDKANKTIRFLHNNLEMLTDGPVEVVSQQSFSIKSFIEEKVAFYIDLYPEVKFELNLSNDKITTNIIAFERVIDNLFSNAIKYAQPVPKIKVSFKNNILIISDNGIGIKDCKKIFERHYREIQGASCAHGFGLGLAIVKKLCEEMNINITLDSKEGKGSVFKLKLPQEDIL